MNESASIRGACCAWREDLPLGAFLVRVGRMLESRVDEALEELGLSAAKLTVLSQLVSSDAPLPLGELATRLSCVRSNITQLVDRMEADGLVRRVDDPNDRRAVRAELTPLGREQQREGAERLAELEAWVRERFTGEERAQVGALLTRLV
ncbi:MAG TPA: MarR family transcriptional regulator [Gemmatimonadaceae bacterium]|nr:MarR family transcriptional regulator [Gemmatimonadaceae bacterium]